MPACFMIAFAVCRDAQFAETVTEVLPSGQRWCDPLWRTRKCRAA
jgi:hypothetical protein